MVTREPPTNEAKGPDMVLTVMVLENESGAADEATQELTEAGHNVLRCHDVDSPAFPCRGLVDARTCPLRSHVVDVALTVRSAVASQPAALEDGARCALMANVPLVVAGPRVCDPYQGFEAAVLDRTYDVVSACEHAALAERSEHARRAEAVLASTVGVPRSPIPTVSVVRRDGGLCVHLGGLEGWSARERQAAVVRVVGALREFDRAARSIDVAVGDSTE
jgi:hypothetical protein